MILSNAFFDRDAQVVAKDLLGKVIRHRVHGAMLSAMIIETEAYYLHEKGSHSHLGFTEARKALFMPAGTIYMYYAHGDDSLNISCHGEGNAVLIKSGYAFEDQKTAKNAIEIMQRLNPKANGEARPLSRLCSGQTLLCASLDLKVRTWNQKNFVPDVFYMEDIGYHPKTIVQTTRLGIPLGRDEHLHYRFVDYKYITNCTRNPLTRRAAKEGVDYHLISV